MNLFVSKSGSWLGTMITAFLILCGVFSAKFSRTGQLVVGNPMFRISMIVLILMAKFYNDVLAVGLAVVVLTSLYVYSKQTDVANNVQYTQLDSSEYKQYLDELTIYLNQPKITSKTESKTKSLIGFYFNSISNSKL